MIRIFSIAIALIVALSACHQTAEQQNQKPKAPQVTKIAATLQLPGDDGHVYVIESPADDYGLETNTCMLHVKGQSSSMSCAPPRMKLFDAEQK